MDSATNYARVFEQLGKIAEAQARIEGMKAENVIRSQRDETLAYDDKPFFFEADNINAAADYLKNWGR